MTNQPYNKREIDEFHDHINENLKEIKLQVTVTNGRLKKLENWRSFVVGGLSVITLLIVPIILYLVTQSI